MTTPPFYGRRQRMTRDEAIENVEAMKAETPLNAQVRLIHIALGPIGNLSDEARAVYSARLSEIGQ